MFLRALFFMALLWTLWVRDSTPVKFKFVENPELAALTPPGRKQYGAMSERFTHKITVITGAATGIGAAAARRLAQEGRPSSWPRVNEAEGATLADELPRSGTAAHLMRTDVRNAAEKERPWQEDFKTR